MTHIDPSAQISLKVKYKAGASIVKVKPIFTYDSKFIILACGSDVKIYSVQSGECVNVLKRHTSEIISLQENKCNPLQFYSCSEDGIVVKWDHSEGKVLQTINLKSAVKCFYAPTELNTYFCVTKQGILQMRSCHGKKIKVEYEVFQNVQSEKATAFGNQGLFVASVHKNCLRVFDTSSKTLVEHATDIRNLLTCVACHGSDYVVATGDSLGKIIVWSNILKANAICSTFHWHTLPVSSLAFSAEGSYLYSGGGEAVLVKWNLFRNEKSHLPRLGAPICGLNISKQNEFVCTLHTDNSLQIINSQKVVVQVIQGLTLGRFQGSKTDCSLSTGLLYDSIRKALVLNGRPGHLQFYDIYEDKQLFNLDISGRNYVTQSREDVIFNVDVHRAAIDDSGHWLATAEYWNDGKMSPQIWLKFWEFDSTKQTFVLNTNVFLPHNKEINCVTFQTQATHENIPLLVTTSSDSSFKVWKLQDDSNVSDKKSWTCDSMGYYRDFPAGSASFSEDGSLLAVAFDKTATLWTVDVTHLKAALVHEKNEDQIKQLCFGRQSCCHLLLSHDGHSITAWNVLLLSISWIIHNPVQVLVADLHSDIFAAFCCDKSLILFRPDDPNPLFYLENISQKDIVSAVFVPSKHQLPLLQDSQLFFVDEGNILLTLTDENEEEHEVEKVSISQNLPVTPFAMLQAENKVSGITKSDPQPLIIYPKEKLDLDLSCPTLVDPMALCSKVLRSLLIPAKKEVS